MPYGGAVYGDTGKGKVNIAGPDVGIQVLGKPINQVITLLYMSSGMKVEGRVVAALTALAPPTPSALAAGHTAGLCKLVLTRPTKQPQITNINSLRVRAYANFNPQSCALPWPTSKLMTSSNCPSSLMGTAAAAAAT